MRRAWALASFVTLPACSLLVPIEGLTGSAPDSSTAGPPDGAPATDSSNDASAHASDGVDAGLHDAPPAGGDAGAEGSGAGGGADADASRPALALVQSRSGFVTSPAISVSISPTVAGDLLVVGVTENNGTAAVAAVTDDVGNVYVSANERATFSGCGGGSVEVWYAKNVKAGATSVALALSTSNQVRTAAWVLEIAGASPTSPLDTGAVIDDQSSNATASAPAVSPSVADAVVVSVVNVCGSVGSVSPPFTALPDENANDAAYDIVHATGTYGAVWSGSNIAPWAASTVAFK